MVDLEPVTELKDEEELQRLIAAHHRWTGSARAKRVLDHWAESLPLFVKVFPMEYRRALGEMSREDESTEREEVVHG
jgi:glutamate synthase domain-containing protein 3